MENQFINELKIIIKENTTIDEETEYTDGKETFFSIKKVLFTGKEFIFYSIHGKKVVITEIQEDTNVNSVINEITGYIEEVTEIDIDTLFFNNTI